MTLLSSADARFASQLTVLEGGSGLFKGIITEPSQGEAPAYQFNNPRRILRVRDGVPVKTGMVIQSQDGAIFMVAEHGASSKQGDILFRSFRLFEADRRFSWQTRQSTIDPVTRLPRDIGLSDPVMIYGAYEPAPERFDRQVRASFETARFITNRKVGLNDMVDDKKVSRVDEQLGIYLVTLG